MEKGFVYVLICANGHLYTGSTRNLEDRIKSHQNGEVKSTKGHRPVKLVYHEELSSYSEARKRELYLKTGTGRDWLKAKIN